MSEVRGRERIGSGGDCGRLDTACCLKAAAASQLQPAVALQESADSLLIDPQIFFNRNWNALL